MRLFVALCLLGWSCAFAQSYQQSGQPDFDRGVAAAEEGNYAEAYCIWKPLAEHGHAESQYRLGWLYAKGLGLSVNEATAIEWWELAARLGHADAMFRLGWAFEHGEGTDKDVRRAIEYYTASATLGQVDALEILHGMLLQNNEEVASGVIDILNNNPQALGEIREVAVPRANIRKQASKDAQLIKTLGKGDKLVVLGGEDKWLRIWMIEHQQFGWIFKPLVSGYE